MVHLSARLPLNVLMKEDEEGYCPRLPQTKMLHQVALQPGGQRNTEAHKTVGD